MTTKICSGVALLGAAILVIGLGGCATGNTTTSQGIGPITYTQGKDTTGTMQPLIDAWNAEHPDQKVTFVELPESSDEQRTALALDFQGHSASYDVVQTDVVWTSEFAARKWIMPLTDLGLSFDGMFDSVLKTGQYDGVQYAAPFTASGRFLYYHSDLVTTPPTTWSELQSACSIATANGIGCYAGQYAQYEGLTVNFSEAVNSAGGQILTADGSPNLNTPEAKAGLQFLVDGFTNGTIPKETITYKEEESRRAFQQGKLLFLVNWPYVYNTSQREGSDSVMQGKVGVAPLPGKSGVGTSTLGGANLAINADSAHSITAAAFISYLESEKVQRSVLTIHGDPPVLKSLYDDTELQDQVPYLRTLKESLNAAKGRPTTIAYNELSLAIQKAVYPALQGTTSVDETLRSLNDKLVSLVESNK
ncbi:ABC transporter substrate-binding protein [Rathayibacter toxicus]|uniref:ABC transporter substrate-binding protein n=1 Tax=Rathayibacter toxicus TaxID=145458 RepID=A0A2S5Y7M2_9MICO|nr:ABC transporter substrate-binding protein [Rathayibacter toxicus]PPH23921.1 ABC transporter substrate-binding protein [Rathayibacter toxicus]PPH57729.1 ABC transporter substrate-binding protein [Rathayibacter toxicus]PPH60225.1 ABC transporter substrate-binding protein [Rathayibacter toxicus]PPH87682.1 ABC transporter substrate-binding protein [Rathayibacter toxicus]PPI15451.1 ABC transporter substrate-binding protein [Rathayibacter toxicus]